MKVRKILCICFICSVLAFLVSCGSSASTNTTNTDANTSDTADNAQIGDGLYDMSKAEVGNTPDGFWNTWTLTSYTKNLVAKDTYFTGDIPLLEDAVLYFDDEDLSFIFKYEDYDNWLLCGEDSNAMDTTVDPYVYNNGLLDIGSWLMGAVFTINGDNANITGVDDDGYGVGWTLQKRTSLSGILEDNCEKLSTYPPHNGEM